MDRHDNEAIGGVEVKKILFFVAIIFFFSCGLGNCYAEKKFKIYKANKYDKVLKYQAKLQKHYNDTHIPGTPWIISCPVVTWEGKYAMTLIGTGTPENDGDDGDTESIEPPIMPGE